MVLNGETSRGDTTWADRTATRLLSAHRKRNGGKKDAARRVVFRAAESGKASNAKRDGPLNCTGRESERKLTCAMKRDAEDGGEERRREGSTLLVRALK